jgi:hypothetical protein
MADHKDDDQQTPQVDAPEAEPAEKAPAPEADAGTASADAGDDTKDGVEAPSEDAGEMLQLFGTLMQKLGRVAQTNQGKTAGESGFPKGVAEVLTKVVDQVREKGADAAQEAQRIADNVVDLEAERRKREVNRPPSAFEMKFQSTLKDAFNEYIEDNLVGEEDGERVVRVDLDLVKNHGLSLGAHLVRSLADALVPDEYRVNVAGDGDGEGENAESVATEGEDTEGTDPDGADGGVALEFDLQSFIKRWIAPRAAPPESD